MATFTQQQLNIKAPSGGFQQGGWYDGHQYWNGSFSEAGAIHPASNQQGAGQLVSQEVNAQSAAQQNVTPQQFEDYLAAQRAKQPQPTQVSAGAYTGTSGTRTASNYGSSGSSGGAGLTGMTPAPAINLPDLYNTLYASSGISDKESRLRTLESQYLQSRGSISDNPFLSASMIDQRLQRLQRKYEEETSPLRNEIATAKADIETQLNLQTKQFDINSEQAKQSLNYFTTLLNAGALDAASGEDIAQIVMATGIPSSLISSAIQTRSKKDANLFIDTFTADSGEVTAVVIDKNTGDIINRASLGNIGNAQGTGGTGGSGGGTVTERRESEYQANIQNLIQSIKNYNNLSTIIGAFGSVIPIEEIYRYYNLYSPFGTAKESYDDVRSGRFTVK